MSIQIKKINNHTVFICKKYNIPVGIIENWDEKNIECINRYSDSNDCMLLEKTCGNTLCPNNKNSSSNLAFKKSSNNKEEKTTINEINKIYLEL